MEDWNHLLKYDGAKIWRDEILDKKFRNIDPEINVRRSVGCKSKGI
jgi:hypothetical protein